MRLPQTGFHRTRVRLCMDALEIPGRQMSSWYVYLLYSPDSGRTYIGATTDVERRLEQHNGRRRGGARATRNRKWKLICHLSGFRDRSEAYRWEKIIKGRRRGLTERHIAFIEAGRFKVCPVLGKRRLYEVPECVSYTLSLP